ncbi:MAG: hypothetical protein WCP88_01875 [bacterium]
MRANYLLIREDRDRSYYALMSDAEPSKLLSSIVVPDGADVDAVLQTLHSMAGLDSGGSISTVLRADAGVLGGTAGRCAEALALPVRILDISHDAGRLAWAEPGAPGELREVAEAALVPIDPAERRRRCDAVLRILGEHDRAFIADRLGDIAERPMSGRDAIGDKIRAAAYIDALRSLSERSERESDREGDEILIVTGQLAAHIASGDIPLEALAPLLALGRTTVLLERAGVCAAFGTDQLLASIGADLFRATANQLLEPAGDLLLLASRPSEDVAVRVRADVQPLFENSLIQLGLQTGEGLEVEVSAAGHKATVTMRGGCAGACVVRGHTEARLQGQRGVRSDLRALPISAPIGLLPRSVGATGGLGGRLLLGDEVAGRLYFSAAEPDSRGWAAAHEAGILAVASASPETVLRARAVGIRGLVVGSLSDGEREALSASIDRRVAAGVALAPFGLLVLGGRRESEAWVAELGRALQVLHGTTVQLQRHPAGLTASGAAGGEAHPRGDTVVIGGPFAGSYGSWRGLADAQPSDPLAAIEIGGEVISLPLGDLQRLTA